MKIYFTAFLCLFLTFFVSSCSEELREESFAGTASVEFSLSLNPETRAAKDLNPNDYDAKVYLYELRKANDGSTGYVQIDEKEVISNTMTLSGLVPLKQYKAVFLAVPRGQSPSLPVFIGSGKLPSYSEAQAGYIAGQQDNISNDIFRSIVEFKATTANSLQSTVLTRQNGALEIRLLNQKNLTSVKLHLNGHTSFFLHDGLGGQVITSGNTVPLENTITDPVKLSASELRIRINLLPQEDMTDIEGKNNYLEVTAGGKTTVYPVKSDHSAIPVFPNQITWLTLGSRDNTNFDVSFSGKIDLDDPQWDGIQSTDGSVQQQQGQSEGGHFRATFFACNQNPATRAAVSGSSEQIQSLLCILYKKEADALYTFYKDTVVIDYKGTVGTVTPQTYHWPLEAKVTFDLPNGEYKAVFVGNTDPELFPEQYTLGGASLEPVLTGYKDGFTSARIHMPQKGPAAFCPYNMFYLATVDFNQNNPNPYVLLQRIVTNNVYSRNAVDTKKSIETLVDNIVSQIRENQLTTDIVRGVLHSNLLYALTNTVGLDLALTTVTAIVDRLVNELLGGVLSKLNDILLSKLLSKLETSLNGQAGGSGGFDGLGYILNPWTTASNADLVFASMTESVNFNLASCTAYKANVEWNDIPIVKDRYNNGSISVTCLGGTEQISQINVGNNGQYPELLRPILTGLDDKVINGLLVNIHAPLKYTMESNLQYDTDYELLDITLNDHSVTADTVNVHIPLTDIVDLKALVSSILGDGIISGLVGGVVDGLVSPIEQALHITLDFVGVKLPNLGIGNIAIRGTWDATYVSDGTVAPPL